MTTNERGGSDPDLETYLWSKRPGNAAGNPPTDEEARRLVADVRLLEELGLAELRDA